MSWRPISGLDESLGISATFARSLNIKEGDDVVVSSVPNPPFLSSITVTPRNIEDWKIVEYQAERIQSILLEQISIVANNQSIVVWISKGLSVTLIIGKAGNVLRHSDPRFIHFENAIYKFSGITQQIEMKFSLVNVKLWQKVATLNSNTKQFSDAINSNFEYGIIANDTEVHVALPSARERSFSKIENTTAGQSNSKIWTFFAKVPWLTKKSTMEIVPNYVRTWMKNNETLTIPEVFRVCNLSVLPELYPLDVSFCGNDRPYLVFVRKSNGPPCRKRWDSTQNCFYKIRKAHEDRQYTNLTSNELLQTDSSLLPTESRELVVRLCVIETTITKTNKKQRWTLSSSAHNEIYASTNLIQNLKLGVGSKVILESIVPLAQSVTSIEIFPSSQSITRRVFERFLIDIAHDDVILLNSRSRIYFKDGTSCMVSLLPEQCSYLILDSAGLKNVMININNVTAFESDDKNEIENKFDELKMATISLLPLESILTECRIFLELSLSLSCVRNFCYEPGNILICGDTGVGKTTFCRVLQEKMQKPPYFVHVHVIECRALKGKRAEAMHKIMSAAMADCVYYQPSILFLDDLESITSSPSGEEENTPDAINASRILDVIFNIAAAYQLSHYVSIIATCTKINKIGLKLRSPRGVHLFRTVVTIPELVKEHRIDILRLSLRNHIHVPEEINLDYYGNKSEGWVAQDLVDFAEKAAFSAWKRYAKSQAKTTMILDEEDLSETLKNYKTLSLHGVQLYKSSGHDWSHIGGLTKTKEVLTQLLKWPLKYPEIYQNAPIKNQNGVLLYGMPGTGKTILAGAIAKECSVNLISVKGPELLSKYIGASEEAVRNVFEKARRAKPCVLFFDEFDSLAPRRGHDSTGVTDRVVNQILTQLDGVEGREGVVVVAASSRPDLLDPALLRPGRLDKSLLCPLPDENDKEAILVSLCEAQAIDAKNLDLKDIANRSLGFTGADLNAILTQAKYAALESALENVPSGQDKSVGSIQVTQEHLMESLNSTNPSLSTAEKEKYRRIYEQFSRGSFVENVASMKQKSTLA